MAILLQQNYPQATGFQSVINVEIAKMPPPMLICSSDVEFCLCLKYILKVQGFESDFCETMEEVIQRMGQGDITAAILDCQPKSKFNPAICSQIKANKSANYIPVMAFVAQGCETQHLELLKMGLSQVFKRPIAPELFISHLHAILSPHVNGFNRDTDAGQTICFGNIRILPEQQRVQRGDGKDIHVSPIEFRLLREMSRSPGQVFSRDELIRAAWPDNIPVELRTVDVHIGRLRRLLTRETGANLIRTVRSAGYAIKDAA
jgi:two-component system, OmpR family, phosphate regulon response regulator PhoB